MCNLSSPVPCPLSPVPWSWQVKAYLNGVRIPRFLTLEVLPVKFLGTMAGVASGLIMGPEGPMVHLGKHPWPCPAYPALLILPRPALPRIRCCSVSRLSRCDFCHVSAMSLWRLTGNAQTGALVGSSFTAARKCSSWLPESMQYIGRFHSDASRRQ